jgi:hypothetical protein
VPGDADAPWDESSAEALTRAWETAASEWRLPPIPRAAAQDADGRSPAEDADAAALDARLAAFAATLDAWLQRIDPQKSQEAFHLRLQQFEQRLAAALEGLARSSESSALLLIEAQVTELNQQFTAVRHQLERLAGIDRQLAALSSLFGAEGRPQATDLGIGRAAAGNGGDAPAGVESIARGRDVIARLEQLLDQCIAERHRDEQRSATALQGIDAALAHIVERIDALEARGEGGAADDGLSDDDRLAQAYRAGARALGQDPFPCALDATDYAAGGRGALPFGAEQPGRREIAPMAPPRTAAEAAVAEGPRAKGALPAAMALLLAGGYLAVDGFLSPTAPPSAVAIAGASAGTAEPPAIPEAGAPAALPVWQGVADTSMRTTAGEERAEARQAPAQQGSLLTPASLPSAPFWQGALQEDWQEDGAPRAAASAAELPEQIGGNGLRTAAAAGDPAAQFEIASRFAEGRGVAVDNAQAFYWLQRAAMHGHGLAQYRLGIAFERGSGVASDPERAKAWYRRAAEQGVVRAMHNLAVLTIGQEPRPGDYATAARWFTAAANRGLVDSQFNLGLLYEDGLGVARDLTAAYQWYALAARAGDPEASQRLQQVKPQLPPEQLAAAESAASEWRALKQP